MTGAIATPRYSAEDFETASIRSAAPSYVSEAPSYHSYSENVPPYSPPPSRNLVSSTLLLSNDGSTTPTRHQTIGLPPVPAAPARSVPNLNNFRIATWSHVASNPTARQYANVAQRRMTAQRDTGDTIRRVMTERTLELAEESSAPAARPLEDPYLVGEVAAERNRRERLNRETGDDILIREDRQWDWFLARIKDNDDRERSFPRYRQNAEMGPRKKLLRRIGGRRLLM